MMSTLTFSFFRRLANFTSWEKVGIPWDQWDLPSASIPQEFRICLGIQGIQPRDPAQGSSPGSAQILALSWIFLREDPRADPSPNPGRSQPIPLTSLSLSCTGLPTKAMILILWFLPCRCFSASCTKKQGLGAKILGLGTFPEDLGHSRDFWWISMDLCWEFHGFMLGFPWICLGFLVDFHEFLVEFPWIYVENSMDLSWISMDLWWISTDLS